MDAPCFYWREYDSETVEDTITFPEDCIPRQRQQQYLKHDLVLALLECEPLTPEDDNPLSSNAIDMVQVLAQEASFSLFDVTLSPFLSTPSPISPSWTLSKTTTSPWIFNQQFTPPMPLPFLAELLPDDYTEEDDTSRGMSTASSIVMDSISDHEAQFSTSPPLGTQPAFQLFPTHLDPLSPSSPTKSAVLATSLRPSQLFNLVSPASSFHHIHSATLDTFLTPPTPISGVNVDAFLSAIVDTNSSDDGADEELIVGQDEHENFQSVNGTSKSKGESLRVVGKGQGMGHHKSIIANPDTDQADCNNHDALWIASKTLEGSASATRVLFGNNNHLLSTANQTSPKAFVGFITSPGTLTPLPESLAEKFDATKVKSSIHRNIMQDLHRVSVSNTEASDVHDIQLWAEKNASWKHECILPSAVQKLLLTTMATKFSSKMHHIYDDSPPWNLRGRTALAIVNSLKIYPHTIFDDTHLDWDYIASLELLRNNMPSHDFVVSLPTSAGVKYSEKPVERPPLFFVDNCVTASNPLFLPIPLHDAEEADIPKSNGVSPFKHNQPPQHQQRQQHQHQREHHHHQEKQEEKVNPKQRSQQNKSMSSLDSFLQIRRFQRGKEMQYEEENVVDNEDIDNQSQSCSHSFGKADAYVTSRDDHQPQLQSQSQEYPQQQQQVFDPLTNSATRHQPLYLFASERMMSMSDAMIELEERDNVICKFATIDRLGVVDIQVDERVCITLMDATELLGEDAREAFFGTIHQLTVAHDWCGVVVVGSSVSLREAISSDFLKTYAYASIARLNKTIKNCHIELLFALPETLHKIIFSVISVAKESSPISEEDWVDRSWVSQVVSTQEQLLLEFPCFNFMSSQALLLAFPLHELFSLTSKEDILSRCPQIPERSIELFLQLKSDGQPVLGLVPSRSHFMRNDTEEEAYSQFALQYVVPHPMTTYTEDCDDSQFASIMRSDENLVDDSSNSFEPFQTTPQSEFFGQSAKTPLSYVLPQGKRGGQTKIVFHGRSPQVPTSKWVF
eukprot:m.42255 g.42255  ORF g.42255 m.42255 type:complete len:1019 (-) comp7045_c0_seq1:75-3131(-)